MTSIELLIPAKDVQTGITALNHGADAVYIGAPKFGARQAAGNSLQDLEKLVQYAHLYRSKVYVTVNTLLYDNELEEARTLIWKLYHIGVDAIIMQDLGILKLDLPPIKLHASTQCHNATLERILFLEKLGFQRAILARELSVDEIQEIHQHSSIELETFVHGALCVCYSGQCYMSRYLSDRSGNRGDCVQACRSRYDLQDAHGQVLVKNKHLLSLKDMNRVDYLKALIEAGVTSLKVEGRLKDEQYVKNITAFYRQNIDKILNDNPLYEKSGGGATTFFFTPDPKRTFNRDFTSYFADNQREKIASFDTPKAMGQYVGKLRQDRQNRLYYIGDEKLVNGDGLCFINDKGELAGFLVNKVEGQQIVAQKELSRFSEVDLYRNVDKNYEKQLSEKTADRKIPVDITFSELDDGFQLQLVDEDNVSVSVKSLTDKIAANKEDVAKNQLINSLSKLGNTPYVLNHLQIDSKIYFLQASFINKMKNDAVELLSQRRIDCFKAKEFQHEYHPEPLFTEVNYKRNVVNELHKSVYEDFGATSVEYGIDKTLDFKRKELMVCKYCIRYELGLCSKEKSRREVDYPLFLVDNQHKYMLDFDCKKCEMHILAINDKN